MPIKHFGTGARSMNNSGPSPRPSPGGRGGIVGRASANEAQGRFRSCVCVARFESAAFTLLELLVVLSIIGILAAITLPSLHSVKPNPGAVAAQQLRDDIARARQLAISQRTTVYMIFLPTNLLADPNLNSMFDKQLVAYRYVALRALGDQPGQSTCRYLSEWKTLPEGTYIAPQKFIPRNQYFAITNDGPGFQVYGFARTNGIPFPSEETAPAPQAPFDLPYIAFNYLGQLTTGQNEYIPISQGSVNLVNDGSGNVEINEVPPGNATNMYNVVSVAWMTGRARSERQEIRQEVQ